MSIRKLLILALILSVMSCVSPTDSPPPDKTAPTINLYTPATNDTVSAGQTEIIYDVSDDREVESVELYLNDVFVSRNYMNEDGSKPAIYLNIDSSYVETKISYYLVAYDPGGNSATSVKMTDIYVKPNMTPPQAPTELVLTKLTDASINLRWQDNSDDELAFEVWRKSDNTDYASIQTLPPNSISTNDTGLVANIVYTYKIRAINKYSYSESVEVSTESLITLVEAPSNVNGTSFGTSWIRLYWQDNSDNELAFIIQRKIASGSEFAQIAALPPNTIQYDDRDNLYASSSYTYRIAALSQQGQSDWSNEVYVTTLSIDLIPPSDLAASFDTTANRVRLTWNDNSIYEIETRIERKVSADGVYSEIGKVGVNVTAFTDSTVIVNSGYYYRVRGFVQEGMYSDYSNEAYVDTSP